MLAYLCTFIVGAIFLFTGGIKAVDSSQFVHQVHDYRLIPPRWVRQVALAFIGFELALGVALVLYIFPGWLIPGTIALLLFLAGLKIWGTSSGHVEDCGCYGGILLLTPRQSLLLNMVYILLLSVAWFYVRGNPFHFALNYEYWKPVLVLLAMIGGVILGWRSQREPLINLTRLKVGKRWGKRWLKASSQTLADGSHFVVFLSKECSYCKLWVPLLNVMDVQPDMPNVIGIMSLTEIEKEAFIAQHLVRFPISYMDKALVRLMAQAFPTAALIENGIITNKWRGEIPKPYFDKIRQFYESISPNRKTQERAFSG